MKNWRQLLGNERGTALALALIIMVIMTALAVGLAAMGGVESRISASQSAGSRARLLAESGIEYAFLSLAGVRLHHQAAGRFHADPGRHDPARPDRRLRHLRSHHPERHQLPATRS